MDYFIKSKGKPHLILPYTIRPLNVLKQILAMFLSADKTGVFRSNRELLQFVLNREEKSLPDRYKIYMYYTASPYKRFFGYMVMGDYRGYNRWAEISFEPFGFLLADDSAPAHPDMMEITGFKSFEYNQLYPLKLEIPYLPTFSRTPAEYC